MAMKLARRLVVWSFTMMVALVVLALLYPTEVVDTGFNFKVELKEQDTVSLGAPGTLEAVSTRSFMLHSASQNKKVQGLYSEDEQGPEYTVDLVIEDVDVISLVEGGPVDVYLNTTDGAKTLLVHQKGIWTIGDQVFVLFGGIICLWFAGCVLIKHETLKPQTSSENPEVKLDADEAAESPA